MYGILYSLLWLDTMLPKNDKEMLKKLLTKNEEALRCFYTKHKAPLLKYLQRTLDRQDAEEVLQDAFIAFVEGLRNFRGESSLRTYLYSIAKRKSIDKIRRKSFKRVLFSYFPDYVVESLAHVFLKDELDKRYLKHKIEKVLKDIPRDHARILRLKYMEDYSVAEIADETGISFKAAESLLFRARQSFINLYRKYDRQGVFSFKETL